jgi:hypothetical protein
VQTTGILAANPFRADAELPALLRRSLGTQKGIEIAWSQD